jgi:Ethylbenzene dehydrogenase/Prokaryotic cytochrome b561
MRRSLPAKDNGYGKPPRTDAGTVILHWLVVLVIATLFVTGLAIAADAPHRTWVRQFRTLLPQGDVWTVHVLAALLLSGLAVAYTVYICRAGLTRRVRLDKVRMFGLQRPGRMRWGSLNVLLYWALFAVLSLQIGTGVLLYLGYGGAVVSLHFWCAVGVVAFPILHILAHFKYGRLAQVLRIVRPGPLEQVGPPPSLAELIRQRLENEPRQDVSFDRQAAANGARVNETRLHAHPLITAAIAGAVALSVAGSVDFSVQPKLIVRAIAKHEAPQVDGDTSDAVWRKARVAVVDTHQGVNLSGTGASRVTIRAVHDGVWAYFAFTWEDPTRSLKHLPLIKKADGWRLLHSAYDIEDENSYYEDKFAVMLAESGAMPAAGTTHLGPQPLAGKPAAYSGRGLHYTTNGRIVDVWHWKATRGGLLGWMDDNYFGAPAEPTPAETAGQSRYKAGYATDPGKAFYGNNFDQQPPGGYTGPLVPKRLPKDLAATRAAMGAVDLDPETSEAAGARWWLTANDSVPFSAELDQRIPAGTVIPGIVIAGDYTGDRADIRCAAQWAAGHWTLEVVRRLDTGSPHDIAIKSGVSMWVSVFDHSQTRHTRHLRPLLVEVQR